MVSRRLLLCSHNRLTKQLGAAKPLLELADALRPLGWETTVLGLDELAPSPAPVGQINEWFAPLLRDRLRRDAGAYDVADYDHADLPFPRSDFPAGTLMVARSVLLLPHLLTHPIPSGPTLRQRVGAMIKGPRRRAELARVVADARRTLSEADLVNVSNRHDRDALVRDGIAGERIVVLPFGIGADRLDAFAGTTSTAVPAGPPTVAFVGTFDYRKGAREMPAVLDRIAAAIPGVRLKLLGTAGMFQTAEQVLAHFPRRLRGRVSVVPRFDPADLPGLLADCWTGIFPSHLEGFGIGVLEMLAAAIPVVAYDAPGPPEMLPPGWLVPVGDVAAMAARTIGWLADPATLDDARRSARRRAAPFNWPDIGRRTADAYEQKLLAGPNR